MAMAATVRAGMADAAFGIETAARAHGLGFVQLVTEHYYLACRRKTPARIAVDTMVATAQSSSFALVVARIGGYDTKSAESRVQLRDLFGRLHQVLKPFRMCDRDAMGRPYSKPQERFKHRDDVRASREG